MPAETEPTLTFLRGTTTIGGVQAVVQAGDSALFFDFGNTPNPAAALFSRPSPPPQQGSLVAHLRAGMAPLAEGLYDPAQLSDAGGSVAAAIQPMRAEGRLLHDADVLDGPTELGVFVSHVHNDHCGLLPFVAGNVPVVMSSDGAAVHAGMVANGSLPPTDARVHGLPNGGRLIVGSLEVELLDVDHDVPGAAGFLLTAGGRRMAWTGDWRAHGHAPERMAAFAEAVAGVDLLVTEGTTLRPDSSPVRPLSEDELTDRVDHLLAGTSGLAMVTPYPRNLHRLAALRDVAAAHGRMLVLRPETLAGWRAAARHGLSAPDPDGGSRRLGVLSTGEPLAVAAGDVEVSVADLRADRGGFLLELQVPDRWVALAAGVGAGDLLVHSNGEPLGPWAAEWLNLQAWVSTLGLDFVWLDSGGHATPDDLAWLVDAVRPGAVAAVHSAHPELFPRSGVPLVLPRPGLAFPLDRPAPLGRASRGAHPARTGVPCASS